VAFFSEENIFLKKLMTTVDLSFLDLLQGTKKIKAALYKSSFEMLYYLKNYFLLKKSFTLSGDMIDSTKVYAPVFGDLTILIAFVKRFDPVCNDATDFFAMIQVLAWWLL